MSMRGQPANHKLKRRASGTVGALGWDESVFRGTEATVAQALRTRPSPKGPKTLSKYALSPYKMNADTMERKAMELELKELKDSLESEPNVSVQEGKDDSLSRIHVMQHWLNGYRQEQDAFNSFAVFSEVRLKEAFAVTQQVGLPSPQRTAVCCELLSKIAGIFGRFGDLITLIAFEIMRGTYYGFDQTCIHDVRTVDGQRIDPKKGVPEGALLDVRPEHMVQWTPYYTLVRTLQADLQAAQRQLNAMAEAGQSAHQLTQKRMRVMDKAVRSWQLQLLRRTFENWKHGHQQMRRFFQRLRRRRLIIWVNAWKYNTVLARLARRDEELRAAKQEINLWQDAAMELKEQKLDLETQVSSLSEQLKEALDADLRQQQRNTAFAEAMTKLKNELHATQRAMKASAKSQMVTIDAHLYGERQHGYTLFDDDRMREHLQGSDFGRRRNEGTVDGDGSLPSHRHTHTHTYSHTHTHTHTTSHDTRMSLRHSSAPQGGIHYAGPNQASGGGGQDLEDKEFTTKRMKDLIIMMNEKMDRLYAAARAHGEAEGIPEEEAVPKEYLAMMEKIQSVTPALTKKKVSMKTVNKLLPVEPVAQRVLRALGDDVPPVWATCNVFHHVLQHKYADTERGKRIKEGDMQAAEDGLEELLSSNAPEQAVLMAWVNYHLAKEHEHLKKEDGRDKAMWIENLSSNLRDSAEYAILFDRLIALRKENQEYVNSMSRDVQGALGSAPSKNSAGDGSTKPLEGVEALEVDLEGERDVPAEEKMPSQSIYEKVMNELEIGKRADMVLTVAFGELGIDSAVLDVEDIVGMNADWNFTMLSYLFLRMPSISPSFQEYVEDAKKYEFLNDALRLLEAGSAGDDMVAMSDEERGVYTERLTFVCDQLTRLKRAIDARIARDMKGHEMYKRAADKVVQMSYTELCRRTRGLEGAVSGHEMASEKTEYTRLNYHKIKDLVKNDDNPEEEIRKLETYLGSRFHDLRKIYKAYAALGGSDGGGASSISMGEFMDLVKDSKLTNQSFTTNDVDLIFIRTNWEVDEDGKRTNQANNPDRALTSNEYVEALVRCAHGRYKKQAQSELTECVIKMFENNIIPYAQRSDADAFRKLLAGKKIREIFTKHEKKLKKMYANIAGDDGLINCKEFNDLLYRKKIVDGKTVTTKNVLKIFNNVQEDGDPAEGEDDWEDMEMSYPEFLEALAAVASFCNPDPYIAFEQRLEFFLLIRMVGGNESGRGKK